VNLDVVTYHANSDGALPPHLLGRGGELIARRHLEDGGWEILATNYRFGRREVDIVARRESLVSFIEVKTRSGTAFGSPMESITWRKRRDIELVARAYLVQSRLWDADVRFDVVSVELPRNSTIRCQHIEDAWRPGWR